MAIVLPLDKMTTAEKLAVMESLWEDLRRTPEDVPSPAWHGEVLAEREQRLREGKTRFLDFNEVRKDLEKELPRTE